MPKKYFKRLMPAPHRITDNKHMRIFGNVIHTPNLWHLNRRSVSAAFAIGLFAAFIPIPFQMILAAALAIFFSANILISVALVWITNPITIPPIFYFAYRLGAYVLDLPYHQIKVELTMAWVHTQLQQIILPLTVGSLICAATAGFFGYFVIRLSWRYWVVKNWRNRKNRQN